jgi:hypothetical protein
MRTYYFHTVDEDYKVSLKVEENMEMKKNPRGRGIGFKGRGKEGINKGSKKE